MDQACSVKMAGYFMADGLCLLASFYYLLYFLGLDWLRQTVLYFLNWTGYLFIKENSYLDLSKIKEK